MWKHIDTLWFIDGFDLIDEAIFKDLCTLQLVVPVKMSRQPEDSIDTAETQAYGNGGQTMIDLSSQMVEGNERDDDASKALLCGKCKLPVSLENTVMKSLNQKSVTCKGCHAASVMMSRHFKTMPPAWDSLTDTERVNFFRAILAKKDTEEGPLKFKVLRTELKDVLVRKTVTENKRSVSGEFLPLETYRLRGFDTQRIQDLAEKEVHPILGDTYRVDIKTLSEAFIEQDIEESLTQVEKSVKRNHLPEHMRPQPKKKAKAKKTGKETQEDEGNVEEEGDKKDPDPIFVDLMDMESDSDIEVTC